MPDHDARPRRRELIRAHVPAIWSWLAAVALVHLVQYGVGRGQPSLGLALSSAVIPALLVSLTPPRGRRWTMLACVLSVALLAVANAAYHRFFREYIPLGSFSAAGNGWAHRGYLPGLLHVGDLAVLGVVIATVVLAAADPARRASFSPRWAVGMPIVVCLLGLAPALRWAWVVSPNTHDNGSGGFLYSELSDLRRIIGEWMIPDEPTAEEWAAVTGATGARDGAPAPDDPWFGSAAGANVLMIKIEGLDDWVLDLEVGGSPVTPFLRELAGRGLRFTELYDATGEGRSSDADYMVLSSQHRLPHAAVALVHQSLAPTTFASVLAAHGYSTFSSDAGSPTSWNAARRHRQFGFQQSRFGPDVGTERIGMGMPDRLFFGRVAPAVAALRPPFLSWMHNVSTHGPHRELADEMRSTSFGELDGTPLGVYLLKVHYTDDVLRAFLAALDSAGALERTMVVVYGDHTESFEFDMREVRRLTGIVDLPDGNTEPGARQDPPGRRPAGRARRVAHRTGRRSHRRDAHTASAARRAEATVHAGAIPSGRLPRVLRRPRGAGPHRRASLDGRRVLRSVRRREASGDGV